MFFNVQNNLIARFVLILVLLSGVFEAVPTRAQGTVYRVAPDGATSGSCGVDWSSPCDLQYALTTLVPVGDELWVKQGRYTPGNDRASTFSLKDGVAMYGGFAGTETARDQRDPSVNVTVLSGDLNGDDNGSNDPSAPVRSENAFHVVSSTGVGNATILDGFTISGGNAYHVLGGGGPFDPRLKGGGLWNVNGSPSLANLIFRDNTGTNGGGMYSSGDPDAPSAPSLTNVVFDNNLASVGGGMFNSIGSNPVLQNVTFSDNSSGGGGGIYNEESSPTLRNVTFSGNSAPSGGAIYNNYGGSPSLVNVTIKDNSATHSASSGGAIFNDGTNITIYNSILYGNSGGEITNNTGVTNVSYSIVQGGYIGTGNLDQDPLLGPLQDNGGFTETMALGAGSPAIDAVDDTNCPATDQRGVTRPQGSHCDIGAYEVEQATQLGPDFVVNTSADTDDGFCDLLGQGTGNQNCTLREAIHAANRISDESEITFAADYTITLVGSQLPAVTTAISITGNGPAKTILQANAAPNTATYRVMEVRQTGNLTLSGLTVRHGRCNGSCATHGHSGGGIYNAGALTISNVTFNGNAVGFGYGGGLYNSSSAMLTNVTFSGNTAGVGYGGGMYNSNNPTLTNVTFSANTAGIGGGMFNYLGSSPTLMNVTFSGNSATDGGGVFNDLLSTPTLMNTLIANSASGGDCVNLSSALNVASSNNLIEGTNACGLTDGVNGNIIGQDPNLGALADNGGMTQTFALLVGSPAIDTGTDTGCPATDQRGVARPQGTHCDIGAYEYDSSDSTVDVSIGGSTVDSYVLSPQESIRASYLGVNNGPVKITNTDNVSMIAAERVIYKVNGVNTSFSEMMGLPSSQLDTTYWLPWYNNVDLDTQLRIGNVSGSTATVHIFIGPNEVTPVEGISLPAGGSTRVSYAGINNGPVKIQSNVNIVAAERLIYKVNGVNTSFSEMMALPNSQLDTTYWLPWYNNVDLDTQLRIGNVSGSTATVHIFIGPNEVTPIGGITLPAGGSTRVSYAGVNNGPVKIVSDVPIVAAERLIYKVGGKNTSFTEMMALPNSQLDNTYWLPWYNNVDLDTQLRFANVHDTQTAQVHVYIGGVEVPNSPFTLLPGASTRQSFANINSGPVRIVSDVPIVAAERLIYKVGGVNTSFSEMMALPNSQLDTTYWLPWYNNVDLDTQLRFGVP